MSNQVLSQIPNWIEDWSLTLAISTHLNVSLKLLNWYKVDPQNNVHLRLKSQTAGSVYNIGCLAASIVSWTWMIFPADENHLFNVMSLTCLENSSVFVVWYLLLSRVSALGAFQKWCFNSNRCDNYFSHRRTLFNWLWLLKVIGCTRTFFFWAR